MCTHSSMRALSDVPRNVTDEMPWALAKNGGVIGITFGEGFVNPKDAEALRAAIKVETNAPLLSGRALDDYAAEDVRKLFQQMADGFRDRFVRRVSAARPAMISPRALIGSPARPRR